MPVIQSLDQCPLKTLQRWYLQDRALRDQHSRVQDCPAQRRVEDGSRQNRMSRIWPSLHLPSPIRSRKGQLVLKTEVACLRYRICPVLRHKQFVRIRMLLWKRLFHEQLLHHHVLRWRQLPSSLKNADVRHCWQPFPKLRHEQLPLLLRRHLHFHLHAIYV